MVMPWTLLTLTLTGPRRAHKIPAIPIISAVSTVAGTASAIKAQSDAKKAANKAANAPAPTVDIPGLQTQAQDIARQNAINSAALEDQFNPGASALRSGSLQALLSALSPENGAALANLAEGGAPGITGPAARPGLTALGERPDLSTLGTAPGASEGNAALLAAIQQQAGQGLTNTGFDSALTRAAVDQAQADLALGGQLPQDVRNLVARTAAARSGSVTGGLGMGRDITARDLGLTSLDLSNRRLQNAAALGSQEAGLEQANAAMRLQGEQFGRNNLLQSQQALAAQDAMNLQRYGLDAGLAADRDRLLSANYATDAQLIAAQDALRQQGYGQDASLAAQRDALASSNYFNQANLLQNISSGDFAKAFQAAQLGQNIAQPVSGLDPGSVANLAVGNANATSAQAQNAAAIAAQAAQQRSALGGQLIGVGAGLYANQNKPAYSYSSPTTYGATGYNPSSSYVSNIVPGFK
jgi:hypothetical protein